MQVVATKIQTRDVQRTFCATKFEQKQAFYCVFMWISSQYTALRTYQNGNTMYC